MRDEAITFTAAGDISLGDHPMCVGFGCFSRFARESSGFPFEHTRSFLKQTDVCFGNLECTHSEAGLRPNAYHSVQMRGESRQIRGVSETGFNVLNVANNHSMQHGPDAFRETVQRINDAGIACCGVGLDTHFGAKPAVLTIRGQEIAFLGYSLRPRQYFEEAPLYAEGNSDNILRDVHKAREAGRIVIVSLHWGDEFIQRPSPTEISLARSVIDAGVSLVIGHHPHVLRGIEMYKHGCIAYSLGNFVCDMLWDESLRTTMIFRCTLTKKGVENVRLHPAFINDDYQPELLPQPQADAVTARIDDLSQELVNMDPAPSEKDVRDYERAADSIHRRIRKKSHRFFLFRLWKYPKRILIQQLATFFRNRAHELSRLG